MDIYAAVTDRIIAQMEQGVIPWHKPWIASGFAISRSTGKPYSLLNQMILGKAGEYVTFKQCQEEGGKVKKGEKASMVVFWKWMDVKDEETEEVKQILFLRYFSVFHIDQCEGLTPKHVQIFPDVASADQNADQIIDGYVQRSGIRLINRDGDRAYYQPSTDTVTLPNRKQFKATEEYYSTAFHELTHSTGHKSRLDRLERTAFFGSEAYSKEELIAEIGAAALVNHTGLETSASFRNSTAYLQNWLQVLKNDKRFIVSVASKAEKAVELILGS
ncbi:MAG: DUF1738 domain-containing protein [Clostridia bacterium]|nr:DUF1738 domain-containing protein [Clostridia bacterium]